MEVNEESLFRLGSHAFIPLLKTRVLNAKVASVVRLDGRRWRVVLEFVEPVKDLSRFTFAIEGLDYHDLSVSIGKEELPLTRPWDWWELPYNECFSPLNMMYNRQQVGNFPMLPMDLFARHNVKMYCVGKSTPQHLNTSTPRHLDTSTPQHLEMVFEFSGIGERFPFDKSSLMLNTMVLVNAETHEATLTAGKPMARIVPNAQFLHLYQPSENLLSSNTEVEVRRMNTERFNQGSLVKLLQYILNKYHSDFYAFQELRGMDTDKMIYNLQSAIKAFADAAKETHPESTAGAYLLLRDKTLGRNKDLSLTVRYLTTAGAALNGALREGTPLQTPGGFDDAQTRVVGTPVPGTDEIADGADMQTMLRYYMLTGDRIVTPADIKAFCLKELCCRYGLETRLVNRVGVSHRKTNDRRDCGYEILTEIEIANEPFVERNIVPHLTSTELLLQKMIEVRSASVYPVRVEIKIVDS